jgi:hypothetical protein
MFTLIPKALTHLLEKRDTLNTTPKALLLLVHKLGEPGHMKKNITPEILQANPL